jgi:hypothetical protein
VNHGAYGVRWSGLVQSRVSHVSHASTFSTLPLAVDVTVLVSLWM